VINTGNRFVMEQKTENMWWIELHPLQRYEWRIDGAECRKSGGLGWLRVTQGHRQCHNIV